MVARKDVPNFAPPINIDSIYDNDDTFSDWLLTKLLNAEIACYKAEKFKKLNERTRACLFDALYNDLHERNVRILQSLFSPSTDSESINDMATSVHSQLSTRVHEQTGSNLLQSQAIGSTTNLSNHSAAFKFSLLNTVRKAFKKSDNVKQAVPVGHRAATTTHSVPPSHVYTPTLGSPLKSPNSHQDINSGVHQPPPVGRNRSSTFDATSFKSSLLTKNQLEPQQAKDMFSTKKNGKAERLSKQIDYHNLYGKIGID